MDPQDVKPERRSEVVADVYLSARADLLTIAATLDRIEAGQGELDRSAAMQSQRIRDAIKILADAEPNRAVRLQQLFSRTYDPHWRANLRIDSLKRMPSADSSTETSAKSSAEPSTAPEAQ